MSNIYRAPLVALMVQVRYPKIVIGQGDFLIPASLVLKYVLSDCMLVIPALGVVSH